ncbi:SIMPL domain-containing protein [Alkalihalobacillus pseudalcaliphilus]|uniref:SIMPL domain-containing protein n=1 Tax=Alkalihalobacillus pseudalcaliphilus TaxID=79884 RepID=UPI00064DF82C|nr:SIMPL domain-containing protein [Alkalihalobacillus pseudalcaliphilus]KMK76129.1 hypothetical protein AB990_12960 [Alkalihalobacillus pseudalcaliphilus]
MFLEKGLNRIVVYGKGIVRDAPNVAFVVVGVETEGKEVEQVQTENAEKMQSILSVLQQEGIPNELIRTIEYQLQPIYDFHNNQQLFSHYRLTHLLEVEIEDIQKTGQVLDKVVQAGANRTQSVQFKSNRENQLYRQALTKAVEDAKKKAIELAASNQVKLKQTPLLIHEQGQVAQPFSPRLQTFEAASTPISTGLLAIEANVEVVYEYE